jgi:hypothetical protein
MCKHSGANFEKEEREGREKMMKVDKIVKTTTTEQQLINSECLKSLCGR